MKKMSVFTLLILTFAFSAQLSFAMECLGWICCAPKKEPKYESIPQKEPKIITPIEAHYDAIVKIFPRMERLLYYEEVATVIEIVNNAKTKYQIKEQDLGLFAFKQNHPKNYNKGASILIALVEQYDKEIEEKGLSILTKREIELGREDLKNGTPEEAKRRFEQSRVVIKSMGLEKKANTQHEVSPEYRLGVYMWSLLEWSRDWNDMANMLYGGKKDSNDSVTLDEFPL